MAEQGLGIKTEKAKIIKIYKWQGILESHDYESSEEPQHIEEKKPTVYHWIQSDKYWRFLCYIYLGWTWFLYIQSKF